MWRSAGDRDKCTITWSGKNVDQSDNYSKLFWVFSTIRRTIYSISVFESLQQAKPHKTTQKVNCFSNDDIYDIREWYTILYHQILIGPV